MSEKKQSDYQPTLQHSSKRLSKNNRRKLAQLIEAVRTNAQTNPKDKVVRYLRNGTGFGLDTTGYSALRKATATLQTVASWNEAYTADILQNRLIDAIFDHARTVDDILNFVHDTLNADCKPLRAYVHFSGFHLDPDVEIKIGKHILRVLGEPDIEQEIIGRLNQHMDGPGWTDAQRQHERNRIREYVKKHINAPILIVKLHGNIEAVQKQVDPIANGIGLFMQFCVGALTDRYFDNPIIIDHKGRFTGDFESYMPVMTLEFDQLSFPNLRGFPYGCVFTKKDVERLEALGIVALANEFVESYTPTPNAIQKLLHRAMCAFADAERAISPLSRIVAYVTACEVFFSQKPRTEAWVTAGMALSNVGNDGRDFKQQLALAQAVYDDRSKAVHVGLEPKHVYIARKLALGSIHAMIQKQHELTTRNKIKKWLEPHVPPEPKKP